MRILLGKNRVRVSSHANERMAQRKVIYYEVLQALSKGKHIPDRDEYEEAYESWSYAIEGKTIDQKELRIAVSFEIDGKTQEQLLKVTVIELS